jgi:hypothetical protein
MVANDGVKRSFEFCALFAVGLGVVVRRGLCHGSDRNQQEKEESV